MNAIVALCHFCEQHGPSVIMCTQPYRYQERRFKVSPTIPETSAVSGSRAASHHPLTGVGGTETHARALNFDWSALALDPCELGLKPSHSLAFKTPPTCRACCFPSRDEAGMVSHDKAANTSYISTQWPNDKDLFGYLSTACYRSLSSEVSPGPGTAFYFGDEINGHVVSYNFQIRDSHARGLVSSFSFIVLCWDRIYLLNLYPLLVSNFDMMASRIQRAATRVYESEISTATTSSGHARTPNLPRYQSTRPSTVATSRGNTPPVVAAAAAAFYSQAIAAAGSATVNIPTRVHQRRAMNADMRSLSDLTKDSQIFYRIHAWFTWLFRAGGRRWNPVVSFTAPVYEDTLIKQEELHFSDGVPEPSVGVLSASSVLGNPNPSMNTPLVGKYLGLTDGSADEENVIHLLLLTRLMYSLGLEKFGAVLHHVIVGNQLVVQPLHDNRLGALVLGAFNKLLPIGCIREIALSPEYLPPFRCNLLSLASTAVASQERDLATCEGVLFLGVYQSPRLADTSVVAKAPRSREKAVAQFVQSMHFRQCAGLPSLDTNLLELANTPPTVSTAPRRSQADIDAIAAALASTTIQTCVSSKNSKLIGLPTLAQQVVQLIGLRPALPVSTLDLALTALRQEWVNRASLLFSFKRCQGPLLTGEETQQRWNGVLASIDCSSAENAAVARFWQGALSQQSRQNTCHARRCQATNSSTYNSRRASCGSAEMTNPSFATPTPTSLTE